MYRLVSDAGYQRVAVGIAACLLISAEAGAASYALFPASIGSGGVVSSSASYSLTAGLDALDSPGAGSGSYTVRQGYWGSAFGLARVAGRLVFYNHSTWDGSDVGADARDDLAIAPDKVALLPGARAGFTNYTSYSQGLNGIMVDIDGLAGVPTAADLGFSMGNTSRPIDWPVAPAPSVIAVRPGAGSGGSSRVTLIWPDHAIEKRWLRVQVRSTPVSDLEADDVFFFGNAVGEAGNRAGLDALVNATDQLLARVNARGSSQAAVVDSPYDFDRNGFVDAADEIIARLNATGPGSALSLIRLDPIAGGAASLASAHPVVRDDLRPDGAGGLGEAAGTAGGDLVILTGGDGRVWVAWSGEWSERSELQMASVSDPGSWGPAVGGGPSLSRDSWVAWVMDPERVKDGVLFRVAVRP